jgi:hypothetical protein
MFLSYFQINLLNLCMYGCFNDAVSSSDYIAASDKMINEQMNWKGDGRKRLWTNLSYYPCINLEGLRKTIKSLNQENRFPSRDLSPGPPEYEAGVLTTRPLHSITLLTIFPIKLLPRYFSLEAYCPDASLRVQLLLRNILFRL